MAGIDLASLLTSTQQQNQTIQNDITPVILDSYTKIQEAGQGRVDAIKQQGDAAAIQTSAEETGKLRAQQNIRKAATSIGTNMDDAAEIITSLGLQVRDSYSKANAALDQIHSKESVGFLDNPVEWLVNQFSIGTDYENYNYNAQKYNVAEKALADVNNLTQETAKTQNAIAEVRTAASTEAAVTAVKAKADELAAQVQQQTLLYNIQGLKTVQDLNQQQLDNLFKAQGAVVQQKHLDIAAEQLAQSRKMHELQLQERTDKIEAKKAEKAEIDQLGETINKGRASLGLPEIPVGRALQMMKMGGEVGDTIKHQYTIGAMADSIGRPIIAEQPALAAKTIIQSNAPLSPAMTPVKNLLTSVYSDAATGKLDKKIDLKDPNQILGAANVALKQTAANMAKTIKSGDATNIYAAPDLASVSSLPAIQETPLYTQVLKPAIDTGALKETNPDLIVSLATTAAKKGLISYNDAVSGVTTMFKGVTTLNNVTKDYVRVGLPPQTSYVTELQDPSGFSNKYDLTNSTIVGNVISKKMAGYKFGSGPMIFN